MRSLVLGVLVLVSFAWEVEARACSCMQQSTEEAIAAAEAIFEGTVTSVSDNTKTAFGGRAVSMTINRAWKGVKGTAVTVATASNSAACGYPFAAGETYLVYGYRTRSGDLQVSLCSHTKLVANAKSDLKLLGKPDATLTTKAATEEKESGRCSASKVGAGGQSLPWMLAMLGALVAVRRRR